MRRRRRSSAIARSCLPMHRSCRPPAGRLVHLSGPERREAFACNAWGRSWSTSRLRLALSWTQAKSARRNRCRSSSWLDSTPLGTSLLDEVPLSFVLPAVQEAMRHASSRLHFRPVKHKLRTRYRTWRHEATSHLSKCLFSGAVPCAMHGTYGTGVFLCVSSSFGLSISCRLVTSILFPHSCRRMTPRTHTYARPSPSPVCCAFV